MRDDVKETIKGRVDKCLEVSPNEISTWRIFKIMAEFVAGFEFLSKYDKTASFFGSSKFDSGNEYYKEAEKLASMLSEDGFAVVTGGGPGIMEAANKGATEAGGQSGGLNIKLSEGQRENGYVKESESFNYFFTRKVMLSFASEVYVFFPGGFGTLDEFFEIITLVQTKKIEPIPVILVGVDYWTPILSWIKDDVYGKYDAIKESDMDIYHLVENAEQAFALTKKLVK